MHDFVAPCRYGRPILALWAGIFALLLLGQPRAHGAEMAYTAEISGVADEALRMLLVSVSDTLTPGAPIPASPLHLRRRTERDRGRFLEVLHAKGHYGAAVRVEMDHDAKPVTVNFEVAPGPIYALDQVEIMASPTDALPEGILPTPEHIGLRAGAPALAEDIAAGNGRILQVLRTRGYPEPTIQDRDVVVHHQSQTVHVRYTVLPGPAARFGEVQIDGVDRVDAGVIQKLVPWTLGATYDDRETTAFRRTLYDTGLFSTVTITPLIDTMNAEGRIPISVEVTERLHRSAALGLEYKTDTGPGAQAHWEHRNMRRLGHRMQVDVDLSAEQRELKLRYNIDRFHHPEQTLTLSAGVAQEEREAYDSERVSALAMLERKVSPQFTLGVGAGLRLSRVEQRGDEDSHELLYFPLSASLDRSSNRLNPESGFRINALVEPYVGFPDAQRIFFKSSLEATHYLGFGDQSPVEDKQPLDWVLATRLKVGMLWGESRDRVPADIRFYGGGGGSIRGYPFQTVSPLAGDDPLGGRSLLEASVEIRRRISESLGLVAFLDGGSAFAASLPDFSADIKLGAGLGLRYFTPLGPLRLDVAVPLDRRKGLDDAYQIYLSIGQAF